MESKKTWYIVSIELSDWKTFKYEEPNDDHITCWFRDEDEADVDGFTD